LGSTNFSAGSLTTELMMMKNISKRNTMSVMLEALNSVLILLLGRRFIAMLVREEYLKIQRM
jgi:hypothetical protein